MLSLGSAAYLPDKTLVSTFPADLYSCPALQVTRGCQGGKADSAQKLRLSGV